MKIALVTQGYLSGGGVSAIAQWLYEGLSQQEHEVHVHKLASNRTDVRSRRILSPRTWPRSVSGEHNPTHEHLYEWGANWVEFESQRYQPRKELTAVLNEYDLIQVVAGAPALALSVGEANPPKVLQVATTLDLERRAHLAQMPTAKRVSKRLELHQLLRLESRALQQVQHVIVENQWMEQWVRDQGQPRVTLTPPGIATDTFRPVADWNRPGPIIGFGRLGDSRKDWPTAVDAYERFVTETDLENQLILAGRGPLHPALVRKLETSPVRGRIDIREDVPDDELPTLLAAGSVFLQSSLEEGLGLAGLEAMACGLPVVATDTWGSREYVRHRDNGWLAELGPHSANGLAFGLQHVLRSGDQAMSDSARQTALGYSKGVALERFLAIYESLVAPR